MSIIIYTDGACSGNPGPGGYGTVLISGNHYKELSAGYKFTTNNRMELLSVIIGLESLIKKDQVVTVYSDSKYVVDAIEKKWVFGWEKINFKNKKNPDLWKRFLAVYKNHHVKFSWVKGHAGNAMNEKCDQLAVAASKGKNLLHDVFFEYSTKESDGLF
jgi:ribonuclease HI